MRSVAFGLSCMFLLGACSTPPSSDVFWSPRPAALTVSEEIHFRYKPKLPIISYWNRAPAGRYIFDAEDEHYIYYRSLDGKVAWGGGLDKGEECEGGLALAKYADKIYVYTDEDLKEVAKRVGEIPRYMITKDAKDGRFRAALGPLTAPERQKIQMEQAEPARPDNVG